MVADVVDEHGLRLAVLRAARQAADAGAPLGQRPQARRVGQHGLQELQRDDFLPVVDHRVDARHADVLQHLQVVQVVVGERHPEARAPHLGEVLHEGFELLVVHQVDLLRADALREVEHAADGKRIRFLPAALFPVLAACRDLADVDLRVEVGREGLAVLAGVAVDDVELVDHVELVLVQPRREHVGHARVEAAAEQAHDPARGEALLVGPLPLVLELGLVRRLVVGGIEVVDAGLEAGVHDRQVLVGQCHVDYQVRLLAADQRGHLAHVVGIDLRGRDRARDLARDVAALGLVAARQHDLREHLGHLRALVRDHLAHAARTHDDYLGHAIRSSQSSK